MKTLQDLIDARLAEARAAEDAATAWRNGQAAREEQVAALFAQGLAEMYDLALGDEAYTAAYEQDCAVDATIRFYFAGIFFPALDASIMTTVSFQPTPATLAVIGKEWVAHINDNDRHFRKDDGCLAALVDALMWITDKGATALSGAPVAVILPQHLEA